MKTVNKTDYILHVIRNPYGHSEESVRKCRQDAADLIESLFKDIDHLRAENERLRLALMKCKATAGLGNGMDDHTMDEALCAVWTFADEALQDPK